MNFIEELKQLQIDNEVISVINRHFAGESVYIPKLPLSTRNAQIWHEFNGRNGTELARKYKLTRRHINLICREVRARVGCSLK